MLCFTFACPPFFSRHCRTQIVTWALLSFYVLNVYFSPFPTDALSTHTAVAADTLSGDPTAADARSAAAALEADGYNSQRLPPLPTTWGPGYAKIEAVKGKEGGSRKGPAPSAAATAGQPSATMTEKSGARAKASGAAAAKEDGDGRSPAKEKKGKKPVKSPPPKGEVVPVVPHPMNRELEELQVPANTGILAADAVKGYYRKLAKAYLVPFVGGIKREKFFDILRRRTYGLTPPGGNKGAQSMLIQIVNERVFLLDPYEVPKNSKPFYRSRINEIIWLLSRLAKAGRVPNTEFLMAIHDCVQTTAQPHTYRGATFTESNPVFTIVSCNFSDNVPFPMWEGGDAGDRGAGFAGWDEKMKEYATDTTPWEQKTPKAVFRGGNRPSMFYASKKDAEMGCDRTGRSRLKFLSEQTPELYDVSISGQCGGRAWELQRLGVMEHHRFKYIIYAEGNCFWADRLNKQVFGPSVVVKQETPCGQFWEPLLRPMVHYLPTDFFFGNTDEQLRWAIAHDDEARVLVKNANEFAANFLSLTGIEAYTEMLLAEYTALLEQKDVVKERGAVDVTDIKL